MLYVIRAVRERKEFVDEILEQIPEAVVYWDDEHDAMKSYLYVCKNIIGDKPAVLLEDDVILTKNFKEKAEAVIRNYPDTLVSFFSLSKKFTKPHLKKGREHCMAQCEYYPAGFGTKVAEAYKDWPGKETDPTGTDLLTGFAWGNKREYIVWCPSLVQHRKVKSVIDPRRSSKRQSITFEE